MLACGFVGQPKLLRECKEGIVIPTEFAVHLKAMQPGLLVAATVALHENSKIELEEADMFFKVGLWSFFPSFLHITDFMGEQSGPGCSFTHILAFLLKEADEDRYIPVQRDAYEIRSWSFWKEVWRKKKKRKKNPLSSLSSSCHLNV